MISKIDIVPLLLLDVHSANAVVIQRRYLTLQIQQKQHQHINRSTRTKYKQQQQQRLKPDLKQLPRGLYKRCSPLKNTRTSLSWVTYVLPRKA